MKLQKFEGNKIFQYTKWGIEMFRIFNEIFSRDAKNESAVHDWAIGMTAGGAARAGRCRSFPKLPIK